MPIINGWYVSKRKFETDSVFLKNQSLSEQQITDIQSYFYKRMSSIAFIFMSLGALIVMADDIVSLISHVVSIYS